MSKYNKSVLTKAGLDLAKRVNAGQTKFKITRTVTSADDLGSTPVQQLEQLTAVPNIMQEGKILDAEEVENNNAVIGVSLRFTNKDLSNGYKIRIIGLYVREDGQDHDFLYAVSTAVEPEYMPDFNDKVLYGFNTQLYLVIGRAQNVDVVVDDATSVPTKKFDEFKKKVEDTLRIKADLSALNNFYTKEEVNSKISHNTDAIATKANSADVYTKSELDPKLADKADKSIVNTVAPLFRVIQNPKSWQDIFGVGNPNPVLTSLRINPGSSMLNNNCAAGVGFGGWDTKGVLSVDFGGHNATITGGNGDRPVWNEDIAWKSDIQSLQAKLDEALHEIQHIKDNYIESRKFPVGQEAQAKAWEDEKPTRLAIIGD